MNHTEYKAWLESLQPKDCVVVCQGGHIGVRYVERVTATLIRLRGCARPFSKRHGRETGEHSMWHPAPRLEPWTEELDQQIKTIRLRESVKAQLANLTTTIGMHGDALSLPVLRALSDAITAAHDILDKERHR